MSDRLEIVPLTKPPCGRCSCRVPEHHEPALVLAASRDSFPSVIVLSSEDTEVMIGASASDSTWSGELACNLGGLLSSGPEQIPYLPARRICLSPTPARPCVS